LAYQEWLEDFVAPYVLLRIGSLIFMILLW